MVPGEARSPRKGAGYRERHREARRREFLDLARDIVNDEGAQALTMGRLTSAVGSSTGGIYLYFPTKDALLAELEREALEALLAAYERGQADLEAALDASTTPTPHRELVLALAAAHYWIASERTLPAEVELSRRLLAGQSTIGTASRETARVVQTALSLLHAAAHRLDEAVQVGALTPGSGVERSLVIVAASTGVLLTSKLGDWDTQLFDGTRLATEHIDAVFIGWGARPEDLEVAKAVLAAHGDDSLAPPPD